MIIEIAYITIDPARSEEFEAAVAEASKHFEADKGCRSMRLERVIEDPAQYRLVVGWDSVDAHMVTFRESENFARWRELAGPFFVDPPRVEHWGEVANHF